MPRSNITLGLDLGGNSIGWAVVDETHQKIVGAGVRVFPEGVDNFDTGKEESKNEQRRNARTARRQIARRARRKKRLRESLVSLGMLPRDPEELKALLETDPYELRRRALDEPLTLYELGRVFLHLAQRRGFLSNRKSDRNDADARGMLAEMNELAAKIEESGSTLGEYLAKCANDPHARIRTKHTRREMYEAEFEAVWKSQRRFHDAVLTDELKYGALGPQAYPIKPVPREAGDSPLKHVGLHGLVFFQRRLRPVPKSIIGRCELEPKERRCARADRLAQRFRMLQELNNLRYIEPASRGEYPLTVEQRALLLDKLSKCREMTFERIRKSLEFLDTVRFNLESGHRAKLWGHVTDSALANKNIFGVAWHERSDAEKDSIVQAVLELDDVELLSLATGRWGLTDEAARRLLQVDLPAGYLHLSRRALEKLLPHMERGLLYMTDDDTPSALSEAGYLRPDQHAHRSYEQLPPPPDVANPVVRQALFEVRKVVNAVVREYGKPTRIHVELARNAKASGEERKRISKQQRDREAERGSAAGEIRKRGQRVTRDAIDRLLLWQEQSEHCAYCLKPISPAQLLGGEADVDHILPRSRCLDNSFQNKVAVCIACNRQAKGNQTPYEWLSEREPERYEKICQWARNKLPYPKYKRFIQKTLELDKFTQRQLNDTRYISRVVLQYVRCLLDVPHNGLAIRGEKTKDLRQQWGMNSVLRHDQLDVKNREDHRHHAVDAIVIGLTNQSRLQQLADIARRGGTGEILAEPWQDFRSDVEFAVNRINVSHRVSGKISGAFHEDTFYSPTREPGVFALRKPLESLTTSMVPEIRDTVIRDLVIRRLQDHGVSIGRARRGDHETTARRTIPKDAWREPLLMPSGVPIKKVRILRRDATIRPIRGKTHWVKPGSNHHVEIVKATAGNRLGEFFGVVVSTMEAAKRGLEGQRIVRNDHGTEFQFVCSLTIGDAVLYETDGGPRLCVVQKVSGPATLAQGPFDIHIRLHNDARQKGKTKAFARVRTLKSPLLRKVTVGYLGRIRWAND